MNNIPELTLLFFLLHWVDNAASNKKSTDSDKIKKIVLVINKWFKERERVYVKE